MKRMRMAGHLSTQKRQNLKGGDIDKRINYRPNDIYKKDFAGEFKEIKKKVFKYNDNQFSVVLTHPDIIKLTKEIEATKSIILCNVKCDRVVFPIKANDYEEAYLMANDIIALIHKQRKEK